MVSGLDWKSIWKARIRYEIAMSFQEWKCPETFVFGPFSVEVLLLKAWFGLSACVFSREMKALMQELKGEVFYPSLAYCTDNGAMIAYAGMQRLKAGETLALSSQAKPRWPLDTLSAI